MTLDTSACTTATFKRRLRAASHEVVSSRPGTVTARTLLATTVWGQTSAGWTKIGGATRLR